MGMAEPLNAAGAPSGELSPVARFLGSYGGASLEVWRHELAGPMGTMSVFQHTHQQHGKILIFDGHFSSLFFTYLSLFRPFSGPTYFNS